MVDDHAPAPLPGRQRLRPESAERRAGLPGAFRCRSGNNSGELRGSAIRQLSGHYS